jgi:hypothetical protein
MEVYKDVKSSGLTPLFWFSGPGVETEEWWAEGVKLVLVLVFVLVLVLFACRRVFPSDIYSMSE